MSSDSAIDYAQTLADADELAVRSLGLHCAKVYHKMRDDAEVLLRTVDIQAIKEFRKVAKEAHQARLEGREDGPKIEQEIRDEFDAMSDEELVDTLAELETAARAKLDQQQAAKSAPEPNLNREQRRALEQERKRQSKKQLAKR